MTTPSESIAIKRPRTETLLADQHQNQVRSSIWFDDGNIVLQASNKQFRVYRGMLARHSSVFKDMLSFPQPAGNQETLVDGCPVVHLSDDPQDLEYLLSVLFENSCLIGVQPLPKIAAVLRLSRKYDFSKLRQDAFGCLSEDLPTSFQSFIKRKDDEYFRIEYYEGVEFDIVNVVRENGLDPLLPCALYDCLKYDLVDIFRGYELIQEETSSRSILSREDQALCAIAREKLTTSRFMHSFEWMTEDFESIPASGCGRDNRIFPDCLYGRRAIYGETVDTDLELKTLGFYEFDTDTYEDHLCSVCLREAKVHHEEGRRTMWELLPPLYFDLPPWNKYKNFEL